MIKKIITQKSHSKKNQFIKYFFAGGCAFILDFTTFIFLAQYLKIDYLISNTFAFLFGLTLNYILSIKFIFPNRKIKNIKKEYILFGIIGIIGLLLNQFLLYTCIETMEQSLVFSKIFATALVFIWNFAARKIVLF